MEPTDRLTAGLLNFHTVGWSIIIDQHNITGDEVLSAVVNQSTVTLRCDRPSDDHSGTSVRHDEAHWTYYHYYASDGGSVTHAAPGESVTVAACCPW